MRTKNFKQNLLPLCFLIAFTAILSACGAPAAESQEPAAPAAEEPVAPEEPAEPVQPSEQFPVQYGQDSRTELYQHSDPRLQEMASSVAVFVHNNQVNISGHSVRLDGYTLNEMSELGWLVQGENKPLCAGELFASQIAPGFCTGFLVKEDVLITAGHCLEKVACSDTSIIFGFYLESESSLSQLSKDNVFRCKEVITQISPNQDNQYLDFAIIKLDRPTDLAPLAFTSDNQLKGQDHLAVLGYPSGLPLKIASNAFVMSNDPSNPFFITNLDTFGSNSGSPVVNTNTYNVEGILVRGTTDYVLSSEGSCVQVNRCPERGSTNCTGENATKMSTIAEFIPENLDSAPTLPTCFPNLLLPLTILLGMKLRNPQWS